MHNGIARGRSAPLYPRVGPVTRGSRRLRSSEGARAPGPPMGRPAAWHYPTPASPRGCCGRNAPAGSGAGARRELGRPRGFAGRSVPNGAVVQMNHGRSGVPGRLLAQRWASRPRHSRASGAHPAEQSAGGSRAVVHMIPEILCTSGGHGDVKSVCTGSGVQTWS